MDKQEKASAKLTKKIIDDEHKIQRAIDAAKDKQERQRLLKEQRAARETARIRSGVDQAAGQLGGGFAQKQQHLSNLAAYDEAISKLGEDEFEKLAMLNRLKEQENLRHRTAMSQIGIDIAQSVVTQMSSLADLMADGVAQVQSQTAEMSSFQKAMFLANQTIAAGMALINGIEMGARLAANLAVTPFDAAAYVAFGTGMGVANSTAIMATTFAGAFDEGGTIPAGKSGIVSEFGDELVNGVMVKGPANVTGRVDTAKKMGNTVNVINLPGQTASVTENSLGETEIRIIAEEVFGKNIDVGVAGVLNNPSSKGRKSLSKNFETQRRL
jgi:hypothetical protein